MGLKKQLLGALIAGAAMVSIAAPASADVLSYSVSVPEQSTNWATDISIPLFDPSVGNLQSITFSLTGNVFGTARVESTDSAPSTVTSSLAATITLTRPSGSGATTIVITIPTATTVDNFGAFDGTVDFAGTSGATHEMLQNTLTETVISTSGDDLSLFTGLGDILLPLSALGTSSATGSGNLITSFSTTADATLNLIYTFAPLQDTGVPEPASLALMGFGLVSAATLRRRRK